MSLHLLIINRKIRFDLVDRALITLNNLADIKKNADLSQLIDICGAAPAA